MNTEIRKSAARRSWYTWRNNYVERLEAHLEERQAQRTQPVRRRDDAADYRQQTWKRQLNAELQSVGLSPIDWN